MKFRGEEMLDMAARRSAADWVWGGLGLTTATVSAGFAAYMAIVGPAGFGQPQSNQFGLFASLARMSPLDSRATQALHGSSQVARAGSPDRAAAGSGAPVDFAPTGTVTDKPNDRKAEASTAPRASGTAAALPGFILRDVFDGKALVESRSTLALVTPGSKLDGAGEVESIERRGDLWVVKTTHGIISTPAH